MPAPTVRPPPPWADVSHRRRSARPGRRSGTGPDPERMKSVQMKRTGAVLTSVAAVALALTACGSKPASSSAARAARAASGERASAAVQGVHGARHRRRRRPLVQPELLRRHEGGEQGEPEDHHQLRAVELAERLHARTSTRPCQQGLQHDRRRRRPDGRRGQGRRHGQPEHALRRGGRRLAGAERRTASSSTPRRAPSSAGTSPPG